MNSGLCAAFFHCHLPPPFPPFRLFLIAKVTRTALLNDFLTLLIKICKANHFPPLYPGKKDFPIVDKGSNISQLFSKKTATDIPTA